MDFGTSFEEMRSVLDKARRAGIVHRDLRPGNVMLTKAGAKLPDFGLAKEAGVLQAFSSAMSGGHEGPHYSEARRLRGREPL